MSGLYTPWIADPKPHLHWCKCESCRAYWASRYDAIAPITEAFIENREPPFRLSASHGSRTARIGVA